MLPKQVHGCEKCCFFRFLKIEHRPTWEIFHENMSSSCGRLSWTLRLYRARLAGQALSGIFVQRAVGPFEHLAVLRKSLSVLVAPVPCLSFHQLWVSKSQSSSQSDRKNFISLKVKARRAAKEPLSQVFRGLEIESLFFALEIAGVVQRSGEFFRSLRWSKGFAQVKIPKARSFCAFSSHKVAKVGSRKMTLLQSQTLKKVAELDVAPHLSLCGYHMLPLASYLQEINTSLRGLSTAKWSLRLKSSDSMVFVRPSLSTESGFEVVMFNGIHRITMEFNTSGPS